MDSADSGPDPKEELSRCGCWPVPRERPLDETLSVQVDSAATGHLSPAGHKLPGDSVPAACVYGAVSEPPSMGGARGACSAPASATSSKGSAKRSEPCEAAQPMSPKCKIMQEALKAGRVSQLQSSSTIADCTIGANYSSAVASICKDLDFVTGECGDLERDPTLAYGAAALTFKDVSFELPAGQGLILAPCSGHFEPGTLVALMGPSGSGKTTLLDILACKKTSPYTGDVHLNGRPRDELFRRITSYVPQEDIMFPTVTVKEQLMFHTVLKTEVPSKVTREDMAKTIQLQLQAVGLEEVQDSLIGSDVVRGISGGQRRRVSLACGLATGAQIFFCDEPTSGLSATDAEQCVRYMRLLCKKYGVSIVVAIHQPRQEVAVLFDHLLLLTSPGDVVYNGKMTEARQYWSDAGFPVPDLVSPTDYFLDLVTPGTLDSQVEHFREFYRANAKGKARVDELVERELWNLHERKTAFQLLEDRQERLSKFGDLPPVRYSSYGVRFRKQLQKVFCRQVRLLLRDQQGVFTEILVAIAQALVVGAAYIGIGKGEDAGYHQVGFYFMLVMTCALSGIKVMPKAIAERTVMKLEVSEVLYSDWAYIIAFTSLNLFLSLFCNCIFVTLVFALSGLEWTVYPIVLLWNSIIYISMDSLYLMVAAAARDSSSAQILLAPFLTMAMLFNGFTVSRKSVPEFMAWALELSPVAHAMEEMVLAIQKGLDSAELKLVETLFGFESHLGRSLGVLLGWFLVFRIAQIICLKTMHHIKR
ncbi:ABCG2 [Symbiodinium natans]|uniref:ABCG2 protein n=1 Tax=Symbiodinium natans TaxID=878477 RepID=A0A812N2M1_9DINO|nr:ABCG2 [Symbiodinium natans]